MPATKETIQSGWTLKNRNYVVTGGSNGIGLATVKVGVSKMTLLFDLDACLLALIAHLLLLVCDRHSLRMVLQESCFVRDQHVIRLCPA